MPTNAAQNWSGHVRFGARRVHQPRSVEELAAVIAGAERVKVIGSRHCFNDIADTPGELVWLGELGIDDGGVELAVDQATRTASFAAGATYGDICPAIDAAGLALRNLASLDHITVVGAAMSATHGSGDGLGNLATALTAVELVDGSGALRRFSRAGDPERFPGVVVSLGALGAVTKLTVDLVERFDLVQNMYADVPWEAILADFDAVSSAGYSVSLFPTFQSEACERVLVKRQVTADGTRPAFPDTLAGGRLVDPGDIPPPMADRRRTPFDEPGPWHERLPHFTLLDPLAVGDELQSEYFVARHHAPDALRAVAALRERLRPVLFVSEVRTMTGDDLWLSTAYGEDTVAIHFNWIKDAAGVAALLPDLEAALEPFEARPHWGKLFAMDGATLRSRYPRLGDFVELAREFDPSGRFRNAYLDRTVFG
ncbi:MAG: FAD-binding protein [Acidimicrobiia bacterium]|nr:FAD-binding protein [Acidimicrobiia bacterium]